MNRRVFLSGLVLGFLGTPLAAEAEDAGKVYRIGVLGQVDHHLLTIRHDLKRMRYPGLVPGATQKIDIERIVFGVQDHTHIRRERQSAHVGRRR